MCIFAENVHKTDSIGQKIACFEHFDLKTGDFWFYAGILKICFYPILDNLLPNPQTIRLTKSHGVEVR